MGRFALPLAQALPRFLISVLLPFSMLATAVAGEPAAVVAGSRSVQMAQAAFTRGTPVPQWVERIDQLPAAAEGSPLAVRLADVQFHIGAQAAVYIHRALSAHDVASLSALGEYEIAFQPDYQQLHLHGLRIVRAGRPIDKLPSAELRFLQRETGLYQGLYSGAVTAAIVTDDVRVGDTLEIEYTITGQNPVFGGKFFESAAWDSPVPVALRRITINMPEERRIAYRMTGDGPAAAPSEQRAHGRRILRFEARNLPAQVAEPYVPPDVASFRWIQFSEMASWSELNQWAVGLFDLASGGDAVAEALRAARPAGTPQQQVAKVLEFVQNEIRYLSISVGESSHRPFPPAQVLQRRYGDCKDKSLLMVAMLRTLGFEAQPVLVSTYFRKGLDRMLPSPLLFDHAIVRVQAGGRSYFLDPTRLGQYGMLERMGQTHGGAQVLVIAPATSGLEVIPVQDDPGLITDKRSEKVTVTAIDQPAELRATIEYAGMDAENMRVQVAGISAQQLRKIHESAMGRRYADFSMLAEPQISDDRVNNRLTVELRYSLPRFMEKNDRGWLMRYKPLNLGEQLYVPELARRVHPLYVPGYPAIHLYDFQVTLPEQVNANFRPEQNRIDNGAVTLTEALAFSGRVAQASLRLEIKADRVAPQDMLAFVADARKMNEMLQGALHVTPAMFKAPAAPAYKDAVRSRLEASLKASSRVLADAALTGQDAGGAWCERARIYSALGQHGAALRDAASAVQQQPQSPEALACRGDVAFAAGKFRESAADFGRALSLGSLDADIYHRKALAHVYAGNKREALADFTRAADAGADPLAQVRSRIWQALSGQPASATAGAAAPELLNELWLGEALTMFRASSSPDAMLRLASRDGGNGLEPRLAEAYFYAGKFYLVQNDRMRARVYFQRALDKGVLHSSFHTLSRLELERLP